MTTSEATLFLEKASDKIERLKRELKQARLDLLYSIIDARKIGLTLATISSVIGTSRQYVHQLLNSEAAKSIRSEEENA